MVRENLVTAYGVSTRHYSDNLPWAKIFSEDTVFTHYLQMTPQWKFCQFATVSTNDNTAWQCLLLQCLPNIHCKKNSGNLREQVEFYSYILTVKSRVLTRLV